jgi:hypothetical protein|tara:strand:+ start:610 stop:843 length:234 start_codon:yes stop_codon:yes gene_type:complete
MPRNNVAEYSCTETEDELTHAYFDMAAMRGQYNRLLMEQVQLLQDAKDAIEIDEPAIARSRIKYVIQNMKAKIFTSV